MAESAALSPEGEAALRDLRTLLSLAKGFVLAFVMCPRGPEFLAFQSRLRDYAQARVNTLQTVDVESDAEVANFLQFLATGEEDGPHRIHLIQANNSNPDAEAARSMLLARLNERRHLLETRLAGPLIIALPHGYAWRAAEIAADLWSVRALVLQFGGTPIVAMPVAKPTPQEETRAAHATQAAAHTQAPAAITQARLNSQAKAALEAWQKAQKADARRAHPREAWLAVDVLLETSATLALEVARQGVGLAETRLRLLGNTGATTPALLRDLSVSHNKVGDAASALGRVDEAYVAYLAGRELCERILKDYGENRQALRDLSVSHEKVGDAASALGRVDEAYVAYLAGRVLCQRILKDYGENREALNDFAKSDERLCNIALVRGQLEEARMYYQRVQQTRNTLREGYAESPESVANEARFFIAVRDNGLLTPQDEVLLKQLVARLTAAFPDNAEFAGWAGRLNG
jgi:tetratricopeptide (TPR) repeat protein